MEQWEPWKAVLHDLYITQNRILRDIIEIMELKYNVRGTPKMYKNQFARWGFFKYATKRRPPKPGSKVSSPTEQSSDDSLDSALIQTRDSLMYENDRSRGIQVGLAAVRRFLRGHVERDPVNLTTEEVAGFVDPCYRYFKVAMDMFDLRENVEGGRVLRLAFFQIERKIAKPTMKSFSDLCFLVPHLLLESGRRDILATYLHHLARITSVKFGKHPIVEVAASFSRLAKDSRPEYMMRFIMLLSQINSDTIASLPGMLPRNRQWARNQYLACQRTKGPSRWRNASPPTTNSPTNTSAPTIATTINLPPPSTDQRHPHHMIRLEAQSVYWAQHLLLNSPPSTPSPPNGCTGNSPDFGLHTQAHLSAIRGQIARGEFPAPMFASMMECLFVGWLFDYAETVGDWEGVWKWGREGLGMSSDEQYAIWSIHLEELMRRRGREKEAGELRERRRGHGWMERVRVEVERLAGEG